ncbi:MAG TPA: sigma-70 family RNA polymerase sigma factor, partial [Flavisolibacter sp.]|nr:sigma-70 family RNA polymerase sigma factor [Flavisolibacter sp.]
ASINLVNGNLLQPALPNSPQGYALSFQQGEEQGFTWFFRSLYPALSFFSYKITNDRPVSEEIASEAFLKTWQRHHLFSSPENIRAYLYQVVRNDSLQWLRATQRRNTAYRAVAYLATNAEEKDHFHHLVAAETARQVNAALDLLPPECSKIFRLIYLEGKTVPEVAAFLNLSPSTVRVQKSKGLATLRKNLGTLLSFLLFLLQH